MAFSTLYWFYIEEDTDRPKKAILLSCSVSYQEAIESFNLRNKESMRTKVVVLTPGEAIFTVSTLLKALGKPTDADIVVNIILEAEEDIIKENVKEVTLISGTLTL